MRSCYKAEKGWCLKMLLYMVQKLNKYLPLTFQDNIDKYEKIETSIY